uniref:Translocon-associated protein subunit delta n=1 Tax=Ciona savignyi TaxID=51511 RepID=H2YKG8_CIOSA
MRNLSVLVLLVLVGTGLCCENPSVQSSYYTSTNQKLGKDAAFIVELTVNCKNNVQDLMLYADVDGVQYPVTKSPEGNNYQVSWTAKNKKSPAKLYKVKFFDEAGYNALKKAARNSQDAESVFPIFSVDVKHTGMTSGFWISSELMAFTVAGLIFYFVCDERSAVLS